MNKLIITKDGIQTIPMTAEEIASMQPSLDQVKADKLQQLTQACDNAILGQFKSTINLVDYYFSYDIEAQSNFTKVGRAFDKSLITTVKWTAYDVDGNIMRLNLDAVTFDGVFSDSLVHLNSNIANLRDTLQPQVEAALTVEEVQAIVW